MEAVNGNIIFAAGDCTGHGIPGCLVSVVCSNALNRAVKEFHLTEPSKILTKVCEIELETFERSENAVRDGADIALCCINKEMTNLEYAGAHRPLWIIRNGKNEIEEIKGTKAAIGISDENPVFEKHDVKLNSGDTIYISSDGYADQFSPNDKKLMSRGFKEVLLSIQDKSLDEQKNHLDSYIENWKGGMEQTDDILVIGVKISS
jgi:serine phosphatase RsbU (regulator of sigma subunit)